MKTDPTNTKQIEDALKARLRRLDRPRSQTERRIDRVEALGEADDRLVVLAMLIAVETGSPPVEIEPTHFSGPLSDMTPHRLEACITRLALAYTASNREEAQASVKLGPMLDTLIRFTAVELDLTRYQRLGPGEIAQIKKAHRRWLTLNDFKKNGHEAGGDDNGIA